MREKVDDATTGLPFELKSNFDFRRKALLGTNKLVIKEMQKIVSKRSAHYHHCCWQVIDVEDVTDNNMVH